MGQSARIDNIIPLHRNGELPDASLVLQAIAGELWPREALYRRHVKRLLALAYRLIPEDDPEDLVQEAFITGFARLATLTQPSSFGGWICAVLVSLIRMRLRKRRWLSRIGLYRADSHEVEAVISPDAPRDVRDELREVYQVLQRLPEEQRIALVLQRVEGLELAEIAVQMQLSVATVKRRIASADQSLAEVKDG